MPYVMLSLNPVGHRPILGAADRASLGPTNTNAFAPLVFPDARSGFEISGRAAVPSEISAQNNSPKESLDHENVSEDPTELPMAEPGSFAPQIPSGIAEIHAANPNPFHQIEDPPSDKARHGALSQVEMASLPLSELNEGNYQPWAVFRAEAAISDVLQPSDNALGFANFLAAKAIPQTRKTLVQAIGPLSVGTAPDKVLSSGATIQNEIFPAADKAVASLPDIIFDAPLPQAQWSKRINVRNVHEAMPYLSALHAVKKERFLAATETAIPKPFMGQMSALGALDDAGAMASAFESIPQAVTFAAAVGATQKTLSQLPSVPVGTAIGQASINQIAQAIFVSPNDRFEIFLSPEELGRVRIHMHQSEVGLQVMVSTERSETMDLLRKNISLLSRSLSDLGYGSPSFQFDDQGRDNKSANRHFDTISTSDGLPLSASDVQPPQNATMGTRGLDLRF